jgi:hypothetical protein
LVAAGLPKPTVRDFFGKKFEEDATAPTFMGKFRKRKFSEDFTDTVSPRFCHCGLPGLHAAAFVHCLYRGFLRPAFLGSDARAPRETLMDIPNGRPPLSAAVQADKTAGALAVVAGLVAAVKLARVESEEIQCRSPRVRSIISESTTIARMVI